MFENLGLDPLSEDRFDEWLIAGRASKIRYAYMIVLWDESEREYRPIYLPDRNALESYDVNSAGVGDVFIAAYDLYTESKIK